jgi:hypothetical protein
VEFKGLVTRQDENGWLIAGIHVVIFPDTELPAGQVPLDTPVRVEGLTQADGSVLAVKIELLSPDASLPEVENESGDDSIPANENGSGPGSGEGTPSPAMTHTPEPDEFKFDGVLNVTNGEFWTINGVSSDVSHAEVEGTPAVGSVVTVEGYFSPDGMFIVTKIKFEENTSGGGSGSGSNSNSNSNSNDNDNSNDNGNNNGDDGGGHSGSGGGGDD